MASLYLALRQRFSQTKMTSELSTSEVGIEEVCDNQLTCANDGIMMDN